MQKRIPLLLILISLWFTLFVGQGSANYAPETSPSSRSRPACSPEEDTAAYGDCLLLGPARHRYNQKETRTQVSENPQTPPTGPFTPTALDPSYSLLPYYYARVTRDNAPVFSSLDAAVQSGPVLRRIEPGFVYVTYIDAAEVDGKRYYMIEPGAWMRGADVSRVGVPQTFQGLLFSQTPEGQFGWLRNQVESKRTPGYYPDDKTGQVYYAYTVVQIYDMQRADDMNWYLVAPDQWIEGRQISRVIPNPTPPQGVDGDRWIDINLEEQTIAIYEDHQLVFASMTATGREPTWTQPGLFQIYEKKETEHMKGSFTRDRSDFYSLEDVPWTMYFDQARALHGAYWHNRFGYPQSRGCVNLSTADANWLFQWANEGDWVYVHDPSGQTPTDPAIYGAGGA
ncbi:MAG: L,D-transpeptidase [Chloroflexota bacterium]|nr:L,D-transpeptidase [Chloroflexota bacterium]